jgi:hypothetical protein
LWSAVVLLAAEPKVSVVIVRRPDIPVRIQSAPIVYDDEGRLTEIEVTVVNSGDEVLSELELTVAVHDRTGERRGTEVVQVEAIPIAAHDRRTLAIGMNSVQAAPDDHVTIAVTGAVTASNRWLYTTFAEDADAAFVVPNVVAVSSNSAAVRLAEVKVLHGAFDQPVSVQYVLRNPRDTAIPGVRVHSLLFDENRRLRAQVVRTFNVAVPAGGALPGADKLFHPRATRDWKVVVMIRQAGTPTEERGLLPPEQEASMSLMPRPRWPACEKEIQSDRERLPCAVR